MKSARLLRRKMIHGFGLSLCVLLAINLIAFPVVQVTAHNQHQTRSSRAKPPKDVAAPSEAPAASLPDMEEVKGLDQREPEPPEPIPSILRSPRKPLHPRRVTFGSEQEPGSQAGDLAARGRNGTTARSKSVRRAGFNHARARMPHHVPPLGDNQFIQDFFTSGLARSVNATELTYWTDIMRAAYSQGQTALLHASRELGMTVFESAEYAGRNRDDHWYVYDLYWAYLRRAPDSSGWANWESLVPSIGRENVRHGFVESTEFAGIVASLLPDGSATTAASSLATARTNLFNQTGNEIQARDCEWSIGLLSLPGRSGLDLGLALSYSSLVWTKSGPYLYFNEDNGSPSPGFRLGFATIQHKYFDAQANKNLYLLITSTGRRVALRQVGTSNVYEAADSSYMHLTNNGSTLTLRSTDGTQMTYQPFGNEWYVTQIKDRNGNYLTATYNSQNDISTITDTLGRVITFNYDGSANLLSITQNWSGVSHTWATFGWGSPHTMSSSGFTGASVVGTRHGEQFPVLRQVGLDNGTYFTFEYGGSGQVNLIRRYSSPDNIQRATTTYVYTSPTDDCPRLSQKRATGENWTGINGVPSEVVTQFSLPGDGSNQMIAPDGTTYKQFYGTGWQKDLTTLSEVWSGGSKKKWTTTAYTQDNTSVSYHTNPRVTETNSYDAGNRRRTTVSYNTFTLPSGASCSLPSDSYEYAADATTVLRRTHTDYNSSSTYRNLRMVSLPSATYLCDGSQGAVPCNDSSGSSLKSKSAFFYDEGSVQYPGSPVQHDGTNYGTSFVAGRGNVTGARRYNVNNLTNYTTSSTAYNIAGSPISATDASGHQTSISYSDAFSDSVNRNTFAYPTTLSDAASFSSYLQYNYDFGATTRTQGPPPAGQSQGVIQTMLYDTARRVDRVTTTNSGAYVRYVYGPNYVQSWSTVSSVADQAYSNQVFDGLGRVIAIVTNHPGSTGGYSAVVTIYDQMGRAIKKSNPTETNTVGTPWPATGDDSTSSGGYGWIYTQQTYDWQGRPVRTTNTDGVSYRELTYSGCGCAGGDQITTRDEMGRQQRVTNDVFGRMVKTEVLNNSSNVYTATVTDYNVRDQVITTKTYKGAATTDGSCPSGTCMQAVTTFDGYGRVASTQLPQQSSATVYSYQDDDLPQTVTDSRGAVTANTFNSRHLLTGVTYTAPSAVTAVGPISFTYDAAGNRTSMTDSTGSTTYARDELSRITSETRTFTGLANPYTISYGYNLSSRLTSVTEPGGLQVSYNYDTAGRLSNMPASGYNGVTQFVSNMQYRASGAPKHATYGNSVQLDLTYNARMLLSQYKVSGFHAYPSGPPYYDKGANMTYYADGRMEAANDLYDSRFDVRQEFDFAARLTEAYTGVEAHGTPAPPLAQANSPYRQTYQYDEWNNVLLRIGRIWTVSEYESAAYTNNNRHAWWGHDENGNPGSTADGFYSYDAAGRPNGFISLQQWQVWEGWPSSPPNSPALETQDTFDGNGKSAKHISTTREDVTYDWGYGPIYYMNEGTDVTYQLHSSVLDEPLTEIAQNGARLRSFIYAGGAHVATYGSGAFTYAEFRCTNPVTGNTVTTTENADALVPEELDPLGRNLAEPPPPVIASNPPFANKFMMEEPMPVEYQAHWTGELEIGMREYERHMADTIARSKLLKAAKGEFITALINYLLTKDNKYLTRMQEILRKNPNLMMEINGGKKVGGNDAMTALMGALEKLPGNPLDIDSTAQNRPSMQRRYFNGKQDPFGWTQEELAKKNRAVEIALAAMASNPQCEFLLRGRSNNASEVLRGMHKSKVGFLNRSQTRPVSNGWETMAWTRMVMMPGIAPEVDLYAGFFDNRREFGLSVDQTRALTILHELGHVTHKYFHSRLAKLIGSQNLTDDQADRAIVDACFTGPMPSGVAD